LAGDPASIATAPEPVPADLEPVAETPLEVEEQREEVPV